MTRRAVAVLALALLLAGGVRSLDDWRIAGAGHSLTWIPCRAEWTTCGGTHTLILARLPHAVEVGRVAFGR